MTELQCGTALRQPRCRQSGLCPAAETALDLERPSRPSLDAVVLVKSLFQLLRHLLEE